MADVRAFRFGAVIVTLGLAAACGAGPAQRPIDEAPRQFVGEDGAVLAEVLILPMYDVSTCVATRTNDAMRHTYVLTSPFIYGAGARFVVKQPDAAGILVPPNGLFAGRAVLLRGVIAIGPGHRAVWVGELWPERRQLSIPLERLPSAERQPYANRLAQLLARARLEARSLTDAEQRVFNVLPEDSIALVFTTFETQTILSFLKKTE